MEFKRYENETDDELIYRVCSQKDLVGTWKELADILNKLLDQNYTESKYRKAYQSFEKMFDANREKFAEYEQQAEELAKLKDEIKQERIKLQTVNIEKNRTDRQVARQELWYEQVGQYVQKLNPPKLERVHTRQTNKKYLQTLADIHYGSEFVSANNEYSPKIVKDRFEILKEETIKFIKDKGLTELTIVGLSDFIQGVLRMNDLRINNSTVVKASVDVAQLVSCYLNDLSAYCNIIYYDVMYGNHSQQRYLGSNANAMMNEDLGYMIAHYIKASLSSNNRVNIVLPNENDNYLEITNIFEYNIIACHGHQIKNIADSLKDLSYQRRKFYDYLIMGHFHNDRNICTGESYGIDTEVLIAPSICGSDEYSDSLFKGSKSASMIYGFDELYGHTESYKIILN